MNLYLYSFQTNSKNEILVLNSFSCIIVPYTNYFSIKRISQFIEFHFFAMISVASDEVKILRMTLREPRTVVYWLL